MWACMLTFVCLHLFLWNTEGNKIWAKLRKNRVQVINFLNEESEQEREKMMVELLTDYKDNGLQPISYFAICLRIQALLGLVA